MPTPVDRRRRCVRAVGYLHFAIAGVIAFWWPAPAIEQVTAQSFFDRAAYAWAVLLVIGGVMSAWGALWRKWPGEYIGLPALMLVLWIYALAALITGFQVRPRSLAGSFVLGGFAWVLLCRWVKVDCLRREAEAAKHRDDEQAEQTRRLYRPDEDDGEQ